MLEFHLRRVDEGCRELGVVLGEEDDRERVLTGLKEWIEDIERKEEEQIVVLACRRVERAERLCLGFKRWKGGNRKGVVVVQVFGEPRKRPRVKDSKWIEERKVIEGKRDEDCGEVVLVDGEGRIYEGLISNVFVVNGDGVVYTAPEGVLEGSVREFVMEKGKDVGIQVRREYPRIQEMEEWKEVFITNAVRGIRSVKELRWNGKVREFNSYEVSDLLHQLYCTSVLLVSSTLD